MKENEGFGILADLELALIDREAPLSGFFTMSLAHQKIWIMLPVIRQRKQTWMKI